MKKTVLTFDDKEHKYYLDSVLIPNVTNIIGAVGLADFRFVKPSVLKEAMYVGTAAHETIRLYNKGTLNLEKLSPRWKGYLASYINFIEDTKAKVIEYETMVYSSKYLYAGTLDLIAEINNKVTVIDFKTGVINKKYCRLQTAAYENAYRELTGFKKVVDRRSLKLNSDGTYKLSESYKNVKDFKYFLSAYNIYELKNVA